MSRRLPAYAAELAAARRRGLVPRHLGYGHVCVVLNWDNRSTAGLYRVVIQPDVQPAALDLTFLAGLHVLLTHFDSESDRAAADVDSLLTAGAARVDAANLDAIDRGEDLACAWPVFKREVLRHAT